MRVLFVMPFSERDVDPAAAVNRYSLLRELPGELRARGHMVRVLLHGSRRWSDRVRGVVYESWAPAPWIRALGECVHARKPRFGQAYYEPIMSMALRIQHLRPDVVHVFGLALDVQLAMLLPAARLAGARTVVHFHGGLPASSRLLGLVQRWNGRHVDRVLFTSQVLARPWIEAGILRHTQIVEVVETSTTFQGLDRERAREVTGMSGNPVCLSAGRLHPIKDPVTMLRGFELFAREKPGARLYLYYLTDEMLSEMRALVEQSPTLRDRVEFRGRAPAEHMEAVYSSADYLLQASLREWSGLAVLEAMACGCVPVVSSIPAFDAMTGYGRCGALFPAGDHRGIARALLAHEVRGHELARREAREHFEWEMSFAAIARKCDAIYSDLVGAA